MANMKLKLILLCFVLMVNGSMANQVFDEEGEDVQEDPVEDVKPWRRYDEDDPRNNPDFRKHLNVWELPD